jgi:hypothetical protein
LRLRHGDGECGLGPGGFGLGLRPSTGCEQGQADSHEQRAGIAGLNIPHSDGFLEK